MTIPTGKKKKKKPVETPISLTADVEGFVRVKISRAALYAVVRCLQSWGLPPEYKRASRFIHKYQHRYADGMGHEGTRKTVDRLINAHNKVMGRND